MAVETTSARPSVAKYEWLVKGLWWSAIVVSIGWTIYSFRHLSLHELSWHNLRVAFDTLFDRLPVLAVLYVIFEVCFCAGAIMMIWGLGQKVGWHKAFLYIIFEALFWITIVVVAWEVGQEIGWHRPVLLIAFEVLLGSVAILVHWTVGRRIGTTEWRKSLTRQLKELFAADSTNQLYRWGLYLNWSGAAMTTGIIPIIAIIWLLPSNRWGNLMAIPVTDLVSTFVWRLAVRPRKQVAT